MLIIVYQINVVFFISGVFGCVAVLFDVVVLLGLCKSFLGLGIVGLEVPEPPGGVRELLGVRALRDCARHGNVGAARDEPDRDNKTLELRKLRCQDWLTHPSMYDLSAR